MTADPTPAYFAAVDRAQTAHAAAIRALFDAGYPQAHVYQSGGMLFVIEIPLADDQSDPSADYPLLRVTDRNGALPDSPADQDGWLVGLYLDADDEGSYAQTDDSDPGANTPAALVRLVRAQAAKASR